MYKEQLVKRLRERATWINFPHHGEEFPTEDAKLMMDAADAIEELKAGEKKFLRNISALEMENENLKRARRWIPVADRLPIGGDDSGEICENVCLLMDDGTVSCGWMNGITKKVYYLNARDDFIIKAPITRVTHWMPLPQPPKEETA